MIVCQSFVSIWTVDWLLHSQQLCFFSRTDPGGTSYRHEYTENYSIVRKFPRAGGYDRGPLITLESVFSSDTLHDARSYNGNEDFVSNLGLDLRGPRLQSYHSIYHGKERSRFLGNIILKLPNFHLLLLASARYALQCWSFQSFTKRTL